MERAESTEKQLATPSTEVQGKPERRRFSAEYKLRILARREGLYSSLLSTWRRQREEGILAGLTPKRRGRKAKPKNPLAEEMARLQRENERLKTKLRQAELVIDVQKKVSEMLDIPLNRPDDEGSN